MLSGLAILVLLFSTVSATGLQFDLQDSNTTAGLRGIHAVNDQVAWASGADGTILRTENGGATWLKCSTPPGAEKLDFRGIWAWDAQTALVMSSGPGDLSRVYRTADACSHWTEERRNSEKDGFWDAMVFQTQDRLGGDDQTAVLIGDPVRGHFYTEVLIEGHGWFQDADSCPARSDESAFAASNSSAVVFGPRRYLIGTGGKGGPRVLLSPLLAPADAMKDCLEVAVPVASGVESAGIFSIAFRDAKHGVAVGGDYKKPDEPSGTAALTTDGGRSWSAATKPPHGYRSSIAWFANVNAWIAAGTNGSDISRDGGQTWETLDRGNWNALSPPYVVGPKGRIGRLRVDSPGAPSAQPH